MAWSIGKLDLLKRIFKQVKIAWLKNKRLRGTH